MKSLILKKNLEGKKFSSAEEIIDELAYRVNMWSHVAFSPEEIISRTGAKDMDDLDKLDEESDRYDLYFEDENGDEIHYLVRSSCYQAFGHDGCGEDDWCYAIDISGEEDLCSTDLHTGRFSVNTIDDMRIWLDDWCYLHKEDYSWPNRIIESICERNGWEDLQSEQSLICRDGSKFLFLKENPTEYEFTYVADREEE